MHVLLVYDSVPSEKQIRRDAARIARNHDRRDAHARRVDIQRGRDAVRRILAARVLNCVCLHALARRGRDQCA